MEDIGLGTLEQPLGPGVAVPPSLVYLSTEYLLVGRAPPSVKVNSGILFANIRIETAGGSQPVVMNGLAKNNAKAIQRSIQQMQAR